MRYIVRPFRFGPNGRVITADQDSDELIESRLYAAITTRAADGDNPGERPLTPGFGIPDPLGQGLNADTIRACVAQFGPPGVTIVSVETDMVDDSTQTARVHWERADDDGEAV